MDPINLDSSTDLADRVKNLESAVATIVVAINAIPAPADTSALSAAVDTFKTDLDAVTGRLDADEKTIAAMGDALKSASPDSVAGVSADIAAIKTAVNNFHQEVYGAAATNLPFPPEPPATTE